MRKCPECKSEDTKMFNIFEKNKETISRYVCYHCGKHFTIRKKLKEGEDERKKEKML